MIQQPIPIDQAMKNLLAQGISLRDLERKYIETALEEGRDKKALAAQALGIPQRTLYDKLSKLGIRRFHTFAPFSKDIALPATIRLGHMILVARKKRDMTRKELSCRLSYSDPSSISHIEMGRRIVPKRLVHRLASALNIPKEILEQAIAEAKA